MNNLFASLLVSLLVIVIFVIIYRLERRAKTVGTLFTKPASTTTRIFAGLLSLFFMAVLLADPGSILYEWTLPIVIIALLAYSLGISDLLVKMQRGSAQVKAIPESSGPGRSRRFLFIIIIVSLGVLAVWGALYGGAWLMGNPDVQGPVATQFAIGCLAFIAVDVLFHVWHPWRAARKRGGPEKH